MSKENTLLKLGSIFNHLAPYQFIKASALLLQGVQVNEEQNQSISVQWDLFEEVYIHFKDQEVSPITESATQASFIMSFEGISVQVECQFNRTVKTDPYRISVTHKGEPIWVQSMYAFLYDKTLNEKYGKEIHAYLSQAQHDITKINHSAWNQEQYDALTQRYGDPHILADKIGENPTWRLHPFYKHMGLLSGKKVVHLLGSNGIKGVALSLLGADVTIVDFSKENAQYAKKLAGFAETTIEYIQSDVFSIPETDLKGDADFVLMELGVLHYFVDLHPLIKIIRSILKQGGQFLLHEFHPISTKLITSTGKKHKVTGNYFDPEIEIRNVAFSKHIENGDQESLAKVSQRKWTIGEVVTAIAKEGLVIKVLEEEPNHKIHDIGLPKTYTILAEKTN
ncbi:class I SAM-dependent methyltransferase [Bacillus sp. DJP31]|uniref:class I SAM-dependent methyltransferase n=1 Tax=Bacillus sp. DJP31 TaxID=3409789 RepID=UPI003BB5B8C6